MNGNRSLLPTLTYPLLWLLLTAVLCCQLVIIPLTFASISSNLKLLIKALNTSDINAEVVINGSVAALFPLNAEKTIEVQANGDTLIIYEYRNDTLKGVEASSISPDGTTYITKAKVIVEDYAAPAAIHFYKGLHTIVKYVGNNTKIISSLEMFYGNQFAGS